MKRPCPLKLYRRRRDAERRPRVVVLRSRAGWCVHSQTSSGLVVKAGEGRRFTARSEAVAFALNIYSHADIEIEGEPRP